MEHLDRGAGRKSGPVPAVAGRDSGVRWSGMSLSIGPLFFGPSSHRRLWLSIAASTAFVACTSEPASTSGSAKTDAGERFDAGAGGRGSGGTSSTGGSPSTGGGGSVSTGGGGSSGTGGSVGSGGGTGKPCICPAAAPVGGGICPPECEGHQCAYEDCAGAGFIQAACAGGSWFDIQQACGDKQCPRSPTPLVCGPGFVCMEVEGGAVRYECRAHSCGTGPITCDCLTQPCAGQCSQTSGTDFTCNTCPSGTCP